MARKKQNNVDNNWMISRGKNLSFCNDKRSPLERLSNSRLRHGIRKMHLTPMSIAYGGGGRY